MPEPRRSGAVTRHRVLTLLGVIAVVLIACLLGSQGADKTLLGGLAVIAVIIVIVLGFIAEERARIRRTGGSPRAREEK